MNTSPHLEWPFFEPHHREAQGGARGLGAGDRPGHASGRRHRRRLPRARCGARPGWLVALRRGRHSLWRRRDSIDTRALCLIREALAFHDGLADFAFALQGLGSGAISLAGTPEQKERYLPAVARGERRSPPSPFPSPMPARTWPLFPAGRGRRGASTCSTAPTWISNGGIADFYVVFARTGEAGSRGISALIVPAGAPGFEIAEHEALAPHPLATLRFSGCRVPRENLPGRARAGLQDRHADARRLPHLGGRRRPGVRPPRARRGAAARHEPPDVGPDARRLPAHPGEARRDGDPPSTPPPSSPTVPPGCATWHASPRRRRWPSGTPRNRRSG